MEFSLNFVWALVTVATVGVWLREGRRAPAERQLSFVALIMLIVMLFPVISVSDDLWSLQNPAETDTCQRRDHRVSNPHTNFPVLAALPEAEVADFFFARLCADLPLYNGLLRRENPALCSIQSRPPPLA